MKPKKFICGVCGHGPINTAFMDDLYRYCPDKEGVLLFRYEKVFLCEKDLKEKIGNDHFEHFMENRIASQAYLRARLKESRYIPCKL
jgi:hypothetical protein